MISSEHKPFYVKLIIIIGLAVLTFTGIVSYILDNTMGKVFVDPARVYVEDARDEALNAFLLLSTVKAIVAVIEGSDVAGLQVGDVVQSLYDAIDICWKLMFVSLSTLVVLEFLLLLSPLMFKWVIGITLLVWMIFTLTNNTTSKKLLIFFASISSLIYLAVPVSLVAASHISRLITEPVRSEFERELQDLKDNYEQEIASLRSQRLISITVGTTQYTIPLLDVTIDIPTSINPVFPVIDSITRIASELKNVYRTLVVLLFRSGIAWLFDVLIVPFGLLYVFYRIILILLERLVSIDSSKQFQSSIERAIQKMNKKV